MKVTVPTDFLARSLMTAVSAGMALFAAAPLAAQAQAPAQLFAQLSEQLAIDAKCNVLAGNQRLAMELFADEYRTQVSAADQSAVANWIAGVKANLASVACTDPRLAGPITAIKDAASIQHDIFAARVQAIARLRSGTTWATMSEISGVKSSAANRAMDSLSSRNRNAARQFTEQSYLEAERVLGVLCSTRSRIPANCPALTPTLKPGETEYAAAWLDRVEKFASQMPGARADGRPVLPEGVSNWNQLYAAMPLDQAVAMAPYEVACEVSNSIVRADGPLPQNMVDAAPATIFSARDGFELGRGEITQYGRVLKLGGVWAERLGLQSMGLVRCKSQP